MFRHHSSVPWATAVASLGVFLLATQVAQAQLHGPPYNDVFRDQRDMIGRQLGVGDKPGVTLSNAADIQSQLDQAKERLKGAQVWQAGWPAYKALPDDQQLAQLKSAKYEYIYYRRSPAQAPLGEQGVGTHASLKAKFYDKFKQKFGVDFTTHSGTREWEDWPSDFSAAQTKEQEFEQQFLEYWNQRQAQAASHIDSDLSVLQGHVRELEKLKLIDLLGSKGTLKLGADHAHLTALSAEFAQHVSGGKQLQLPSPPAASAPSRAVWLNVAMLGHDGMVVFPKDVVTASMTDLKVSEDSFNLKIALEAKSVEMLNEIVKGPHVRLRLIGKYDGARLRGTWKYEEAPHADGFSWMDLMWVTGLTGTFEIVPTATP